MRKKMRNMFETHILCKWKLPIFFFTRREDSFQFSIVHTLTKNTKKKKKIAWFAFAVRGIVHSSRVFFWQVSHDFSLCPCWLFIHTYTQSCRSIFISCCDERSVAGSEQRAFWLESCNISTFLWHMVFEASVGEVDFSFRFFFKLYSKFLKINKQKKISYVLRATFLFVSV